MAAYTPFTASVVEVFKAYGRSAQMSVDLMDGSWDYWAVIDRPVEELRARYRIIRLMRLGYAGFRSGPSAPGS